MNLWEDAEEILQQVKSNTWTPELFERVKNNSLVSPCIHNRIRQVLTSKAYEQFDSMYCEYVKPGQKDLVRWLKKKKKEGESKDWEMEKMILLQKKKELLQKKLKLLMQNSQK